MLVLWRRHTYSCRNREDGRDYLKCRCPLWIDWRIGGKRIRKPLHTRDWQVAQIRARQLEADGITSETVPLTLEQCAKKFLEDAKARGLREASLYKYRLVLKQLQAFGEERGLVFISSFGVEELRAFRESWSNKNLSAKKKLEHLKFFFRFCHDSNWIKQNPSKTIKPPKVDDPPVLPFTDAEIGKIVTACDRYPSKDPGRRAQLRALVLLMLHSGLRIGDAVTLNRDKIKSGHLALRTEKSGTVVNLPLHPEALRALEKLGEDSANLYFWNGESKRSTVIKTWERTLKGLFTEAGVPNAHAHRFRHSFAVRLLQQGVTMENAAILLGHRNMQITQRHYASWVPSRQKTLEESVRSTWAQFGHTKNTSSRHTHKH